MYTKLETLEITNQTTHVWFAIFFTYDCVLEYHLPNEFARLNRSMMLDLLNAMKTHDKCS